MLDHSLSGKYRARGGEPLYTRRDVYRLAEIILPVVERHGEAGTLVDADLERFTEWCGAVVKSGDGSRRAEPPSAWLKGGIGGSEGADAARYLLAPPLIQPVELNTRVAAIARERGWNPCKLSSDQRLALMGEVLDSLPKPVPPERAQPKQPTPSERHAQDLLEQAHAAAGGTGEYSEGMPGTGAARFDHPKHGW